MPCFAAARGLDRRPDAEALGVYYERPQIVVDGTDRPWVVVRHFFENQLAGHDAVVHHIEKGWRLDARALLLTCADGEIGRELGSRSQGASTTWLW